MNRSLTITKDVWPLRKPFIIARGSKTEAYTLTVTLEQNGHIGRGECVPYARYGESFESVRTQLESLRAELESGLTRQALRSALPAGAARNAIDCALWDLEAKIADTDVGALSGLGWPSDISTVQTISILSPDEMGAEAQRLSNFPVLKVKLNAEQIIERISAINRQAPDATLLIDANESWTADILTEMAPKLAELNVAMIEQPFPAGQDAAISQYAGPIPVFADESCHTRDDLAKLPMGYAGINVKLDKAGGLTEAIALTQAAKAAGYDIMLGCMVGSSLAMAPAMFLAPSAKYVDLDGPALLAKDRTPALEIRNGVIADLPMGLWGHA